MTQRVRISQEIERKHQVSDYSYDIAYRIDWLVFWMMGMRSSVAVLLVVVGVDVD